MKYLPLLLCLWLLASCTATHQQTARAENGDRVEGSRTMKNHDKVDVNTAESGVDLVSYLRRIPGLQIMGRGESATVRLRNNASLGGEHRPLFVVDGTPVGNSLASLYQMVDPNEIKSVEVLKTPSETSAYGTRGSAGVIEFTLRGVEE